MVKETQEISERNGAHAAKLIHELACSGISHFCIAPGSNNTPLTIAADAHPLTKTHVHYDERSLAFFAMGIAKGGEGACIITTAGTAVANLYPAIVEASQSNTPLVILTADRSHDLRDTLANQTIDQSAMFGSYIRWFFELPISSDNITEKVIQTAADQARYRSIASPAGPVWLNVPIQDPKFSISPATLSDITKPLTTYTYAERSLSPDAAKHLADMLQGFEHGLIIVGPSENSIEAEVILSFAERLGWPIFADPTAQLRSQGKEYALISYYNLLLECTPAKETMLPEAVLHLGGPMVSATLQKWISNAPLKRYIHIADFPRRCDPSHMVTDRVEMRPERFCQLLSPYLTPPSQNSWLSLWKEYSLSIEEEIKHYFCKENGLSEPEMVFKLSQMDLSETNLFVAASLAIRHTDTLFFPSHWMPGIFANRGASGIDGTLSTGAGIAVARKKRAIVLTGDQAYLYDVGALSMIRNSGISLTIIAFNNSGGGIFQFLPIAEKKEYFERYYTEFPTESLSSIARAYQIPSRVTHSWQEFETALEESATTSGPFVIEIPTHREDTFEIYQDLKMHLSMRLSKSSIVN